MKPARSLPLPGGPLAVFGRLLRTLTAAALLGPPLCALSTPSPDSSRTTVDFNFDWRFLLDGTPANPHQPGFDDSSWRQLRLPHDWSAELPFDQALGNGATAFLPGGIGWYRKTFTLPAGAADRLTRVEFDGVYNNAEVWINGHALGARPYGYIPFAHDLTPWLRPAGEPNVLAVRVDRSAFIDCRWYPGSGIYRDVRLVTTHRVHVPQWGLAVSTPVVEAARAEMRVDCPVRNADSTAAELLVETALLDPAGQPVASAQAALSLLPGAQATVSHRLPVPAPQLWSPNTPALYRAVVSVRSGSTVLDEVSTTVGLRSIRFDATEGFFLNGQRTLLKGVCLHHDGGAVGAAVPDAVWERRLRALRALGCNAIRTAHNPPSAAFLDLCDRLGFLVQVEAFDEWTNPKDKRNNYNQSQSEAVTAGYTRHFPRWAETDIKDMVRRDRNHPCVIMWSIGNEIEWTYPGYGRATGYWETPRRGNYYYDLPPNDLATRQRLFAQTDEKSRSLAPTAQRLADWVREIDRTRPVTANLVIPTVSHFSGYTAALDIVGYSYRRAVYDYCYKLWPEKHLYGAENWGQWEEWKAVLDRPWLSGIFLWTGISYLGESSRWPIRGSGSGLLDFAGFPRARAEFFRTIWRDDPHVHLATQRQAESPYRLDATGQVAPEPARPRDDQWGWPALRPHWNYAPGEPIYIEAYANTPTVELFLGDRSLGLQRLADQPDRLFKWIVPFAPGQLRLVGRDTTSASVATARLTSTGPAHTIALATDPVGLQPTPNSVFHVVAQLMDTDGCPVRHEQRRLTFAVRGAEILGVDNGSSVISGPLRANHALTDTGRCLLILRTAALPGPLVITASSPDLRSGELQLAPP